MWGILKGNIEHATPVGQVPKRNITATLTLSQ
jgi:hypothetical protein